MAGLGPTELIIILLIALVIFGAGRLAGIGGALGQAIKDFRKTISGADEEIKKVEKDIKEITEVKEEKSG
ncbi:TPA: twin-arginine translocase TatA/TatE family subunit [bacterium]|nr:twin-arginine translocase TatA/TatE family subunit [bacterium]